MLRVQFQLLGLKFLYLSWGDLMMILYFLINCFMPRNVCSICKMNQVVGPEPGNTRCGLCSIFLSLGAPDSVDRGHCIVPFVGLRFLLAWSKKGFCCFFFFFPSPSRNFPSPPLAWRLYWEFSQWLFGFYVPLNCFRLGLFSFSACLGSQQDCPEPETSEELNQDEKGH